MYGGLLIIQSYFFVTLLNTSLCRNVISTLFVLALSFATSSASGDISTAVILVFGNNFFNDITFWTKYT